MSWFIVYMKTVHSKWPLQLFSSKSLEENPINSLDDVKHYLIKNGKIFYRDVNIHEPSIRRTLYKSQVTSVTGPISVSREKTVSLEDVMTLNEATEKWMNISKVDTIRKAILSGRFYEWEARKSGSVWLVTTAGMYRLFGPPDEYAYPSLVVQQAVFNDGDPYWKPIL